MLLPWTDQSLRTCGASQKTQGLRSQWFSIIILKFSCDNIYERDSSFRKKGTAIGYGTKSDFTKDLTASPGSSKYKLKTIFDKSKSTKRGYTMNLSR